MAVGLIMSASTLMRLTQSAIVDFVLISRASATVPVFSSVVLRSYVPAVVSSSNEPTTKSRPRSAAVTSDSSLFHGNIGLGGGRRKSLHVNNLGAAGWNCHHGLIPNQWDSWVRSWRPAAVNVDLTTPQGKACGRSNRGSGEQEGSRLRDRSLRSYGDGDGVVRIFVAENGVG